MEIKELVNKIFNAETLEDLSNVGKALLETNNGYKRALVELYKRKKQEIISGLLRNDSVFSNLYFIIAKANKEIIGNIGKLLYKIKDTGILTKYEINVLFDYYDKKRNRLTKSHEVDTEVEDVEDVE